MSRAGETTLAVDVVGRLAMKPNHDGGPPTMPSMPRRHDAATLATLAGAREIRLETSSIDGTRTHLTTIWVVTDRDQVFVRSVRGPAGRWFREVRHRPSAILHAAGLRIPVRAELVGDAVTVQRVSDAIATKYGPRSGSTKAMLQPHTLPTTLRLDPAGIGADERSGTSPRDEPD
jgi:hypothetical protein